MEENPFELPQRSPQAEGVRWVKSSLSDPDGFSCVEVADLPGGLIGVRNGKGPIPPGSILRFTPEEWKAFIGGVMNGEFDRFAK